MDEEMNKIIEKFDSYMDKQGITLDGKHNISKYMTEIYWEEIKMEGEEEPDEEEDDDFLDDLEDSDEVNLIEDSDEELEDLEPKKEKPKLNVNNLIKKQQAKIQKKQVKIKNDGDN